MWILSIRDNTTFIFYCYSVGCHISCYRCTYVVSSSCITQFLLHHFPERATSLSVGTAYLLFETCWIKQVFVIELKLDRI